MIRYLIAACLMLSGIARAADPALPHIVAPSDMTGASYIPMMQNYTPGVAPYYDLSFIPADAFKAALTGAKGDTGSTGAAGSNGTNGSNGADGATGSVGATGATGAAAPTFNYSLPASKTIAVSTDYQAANPAKAAVIYPSFSCQNATTILAASACTAQVRVGASTVTCSTGTIYYTQSLTVQLGVLLTQASINPVPVHLPIGAHFIVCPTAGTFTITAVEQTAG